MINKKEKNIEYRLEPIDVFSLNGDFIKKSFREAIKILFKKKLITVYSHNPFSVKFKCEHLDYIEKSEDDALNSIKKTNDSRIKYYQRIKESGKRPAPIKKGKRRTKEEEERLKNFFNYPSKKDSYMLYMKMNKDKIKNLYLKRKNSGSLEKQDVFEIGKSQDWKCFYCTKDVSKKYSKDHYMPIKYGGLTDKKNIVICCAKCNSVKSKKTPLEFYKYVLSYGIKGYIYENSLFFKRIKSEIDNQKPTKD